MDKNTNTSPTALRRTVQVCAMISGVMAVLALGSWWLDAWRALTFLLADDALGAVAGRIAERGVTMPVNVGQGACFYSTLPGAEKTNAGEKS